MKNKILLISGLFMLLSFFLISCKKEKTPLGPPDVLTGGWEEVPQSAYSRRLSFSLGGKFSMQMRDQSNQYWISEVIGKYSISGDQLMVNISSSLEKSSTGKIITNTPTSYVLFENGKFNIDNRVLTVNYTTYPADAPVPTVAKFNQLIPID